MSWLPSVSSVSGSSTVAYFCEESTFGGAVDFRPGLDEHLFYVVSHFQDFHNDILSITADPSRLMQWQNMQKELITMKGLPIVSSGGRRK